MVAGSHVASSPSSSTSGLGSTAKKPRMPASTSSSSEIYEVMNPSYFILPVRIARIFAKNPL